MRSTRAESGGGGRGGGGGCRVAPEVLGGWCAWAGVRCGSEGASSLFRSSQGEGPTLTIWPSSASQLDSLALPTLESPQEMAKGAAHPRPVHPKSRTNARSPARNSAPLLPPPRRARKGRERDRRRDVLVRTRGRGRHPYGEVERDYHWTWACELAGLGWIGRCGGWIRRTGEGGVECEGGGGSWGAVELG